VTFCALIRADIYAFSVFIDLTFFQTD